MITFFRRLRKRFIDNSAFRKYILYAFGEIALVVIGILIALQINNWNEDRKTQSLVETHLSNIKRDLEYDKASSMRNFMGSEFRYRSFGYLLELAGYDDIRWPKTDSFFLHRAIPLSDTLPLWMAPITDSFNREFINLSFSWLDRGFFTKNINTSALEEMKSSGLFSEIRNHELKDKINLHYNHQFWRFGEGLTAKAVRISDELGNYLRDQYGIFTLDISDVVDPIGMIRSDPQLAVRIKKSIEFNRARCTDYVVLQGMAQELIDAIDAELKE